MRKHTVSSADNTTIAYWTSGNGPPLILVHGTTADHTRWRQILPLLEPHATLHAVDRRGRGDSGDGPDYSIDREFEDIAAVVHAVAGATGGPVDVLGHSYGATCALGGARLAGDALRRLVLYEPALSVKTPANLMDRLEESSAAGRSAEVLDTFFREVVEMPPAELELLRALPAWQARLAAAHTIPRELYAEGDLHPEPDWLTSVTAPTLLLLGGDSPPWAAETTDVIRGALSDARVEVLPGQQHVAIDTAPALFAEFVVTFLSGKDESVSVR